MSDFNKLKKSNKPEIKLACYRKQDWAEFINSIDDKESMHDTWDEWNVERKKLKKMLLKQGFKVHDVVIDIKELIVYCAVHNLKNTTATRSKYVERLKLDLE